MNTILEFSKNYTNNSMTSENKNFKPLDHSVSAFSAMCSCTIVNIFIILFFIKHFDFIYFLKVLFGFKGNKKN